MTPEEWLKNFDEQMTQHFLNVYKKNVERMIADGLPSDMIEAAGRWYWDEMPACRAAARAQALEMLANIRGDRE